MDGARRRSSGTGRVVAAIMPGARHLARGLRRWLKKAQVLRAALHTSNETQRSIVSTTCARPASHG
jgi:hypothetical protein